MGPISGAWEPFRSLCDRVYFVDDQVLDLGGPFRRHAVVDLRGIGFVSPLFQYAGRRDVGHHVVRVAADPDGVLAAEFLLGPQVVVDYDLAAEGDPDELVAE